MAVLVNMKKEKCDLRILYLTVSPQPGLSSLIQGQGLWLEEGLAFCECQLEGCPGTMGPWLPPSPH